jgi:hypothetical protein
LDLGFVDLEDVARGIADKSKLFLQLIRGRAGAAKKIK